MDIVSDRQPLAGAGIRASGSNITVEPVLGFLDLAGGIVLIVVGVDVEVDGVISKGSEIGLTAGLGSAARIRRAHVGGEETEDVAESHLVLDHLVGTLAGRDGRKIQVSPGVGGDLIAIGIHSLDGIDEAAFRKIDLTLPDVVTGDEESRHRVVRHKKIQDVISVVLSGAIIISKGDGARFRAFVNAVTTILDVSELRTINSGGVGSSRGNVLGAARSIVVQTAGRVAELAGGTAPCI
jgi:hypothetical protein